MGRTTPYCGTSERIIFLDFKTVPGLGFRLTLSKLSLTQVVMAKWGLLTSVYTCYYLHLWECLTCSGEA